MTASPVTPFEKWKPRLQWDSEAGRTLLCLVAALPKERNFSITVFGSAPLQLACDANFLSADVDIFAEEDFSALIREHHLGKYQRAVYIEQCVPNTFSAGADWPMRAYTEQVENVAFCFPHPVDILVSKLQRLEEKDIRAFQLVRQKTGAPTAEQLKWLLMNAVDLFRPRFDEEADAGDIRINTARIWQILYGQTINVIEEIIKPALKQRKQDYGQTGQDRKGDLSNLKRQ
jgi:hypothetical protein